MNQTNHNYLLIIVILCKEQVSMYHLDIIELRSVRIQIGIIFIMAVIITLCLKVYNLNVVLVYLLLLYDNIQKLKCEFR